ncbi:MAG: type II/IV secretion system ATPase subunit, partial [Ignisphaera sp.]
MSEFGKSIAEYSIGYGDNVIVSIVELSDGKLLYIVKEPLLDDVGKKFRERVYRFITNDVEIIKKISSFTSFDEGYDFVKDLVQKLCKKFIGKCSDSVISSIVYYVLRDFIGYGEVDPLIRDPNIEDVTCDGHDRPIYVFHNKYEWLETNKVLSREELEKVIRRLTYRAGKEASVAQPIVEGILNPEGYRIHVVLDVVSMSGHSFTIRKFRETPYTILELINNGTLSPGVAALLWIAAENKQGMIFYGPTGSGKTTLMNAVAMLLPPELKIVTAEDTPEIRLPFHDNWVSMVTRLSSDAYVQSVTLQAQVESAMRQRPDILILGEIRSREAYSFFQAVSTGHGGLTTIHAENVESLVRRLVAPPMSVPKALVA